MPKTAVASKSARRAPAPIPDVMTAVAEAGPRPPIPSARGPWAIHRGLRKGEPGDCLQHRWDALRKQSRRYLYDFSRSDQLLLVVLTAQTA
jgi:hypothetical protein